MLAVPLESRPNMLNRCSFDPSTIRCEHTEAFTCPECGETVMAGMPHTTDWDDRAQYDRLVIEWVEEHLDD